MCVIVVKPSNTKLPTFETLKDCWDANPHGAGFMYALGGYVHIKKGFETFKDFKKAVEKLSKDYNTFKNAIVFHFRITSKGSTCPQQTHPLPITTHESKLSALNVSCSLGVAHNGTINITPKTGLNDTQTYIKNELFYMCQSMEVFKNKFFSTIVENRTHSKLAFLNASGTFQLVGKFEKDTDGCYYSNLYHQWKPFYTGYSTYQYTYPTNSYIQDYNHATLELEEDENMYIDYVELQPLDDVNYKVVDSCGNVLKGQFYIDSSLFVYENIDGTFYQDTDIEAWQTNGDYPRFDINKAHIEKVLF